MFRAYFIFLSFLFIYPSSQLLRASGTDLTLFYGSRYVAMGGQQIALADDAFSPFYNPAGLMGIERFNFAANSSNLLTQYGAPMAKNDQQRQSTWGWGPLFYIGSGYRLTDRIVVGMGVYPTALQGGRFENIDYSADLRDRKWELLAMRIEFAPSIALKIFENLSAGLSYRIGYNRYETTSGVYSPGIPGQANAILFDTTVDQWDAKGLKLGLRLQDFNGFDLALTYRFRQTVSLTGDTERLIDAVADNNTIESEENFSSSQKFKLPAKLQFGSSYELIPDRALIAFAYEFIQTSVLKTSRVLNREDASEIASFPTQYRDGHTFHLGGEYMFFLAKDQKIRSMAGLAVDRQITKSSLPNPVLPPADDYIGYSIGAQYLWGNHTLGIALNYGFYDSKTAAVSPSLQNVVFAGDYSLKSFLGVIDYQISF